MLINIKIVEALMYYEYAQDNGNLFDRVMDLNTRLNQRRFSKLRQNKKKENIPYKYTLTAVRVKKEWGQE
jgi:hypothetical protein